MSAPFFDRKKLAIEDVVYIGTTESELTEASVSKIGHKYFYATWQTVSGYGVNEEKFSFVDGQSPGRFYRIAWPSDEARSQFVAAQKAERDRNDAYSDFKRSIPWKAPDGVTLADIQEVCRLLKMTGAAP